MSQHRDDIAWILGEDVFTVGKSAGEWQFRKVTKKSGTRNKQPFHDDAYELQHAPTIIFHDQCAIDEFLAGTDNNQAVLRKVIGAVRAYPQSMVLTVAELIAEIRKSYPGFEPDSAVKDPVDAVVFVELSSDWDRQSATLWDLMGFSLALDSSQGWCLSAAAEDSPFHHSLLVALQYDAATCETFYRRPQDLVEPVKIVVGPHGENDHWGMAAHNDDLHGWHVLVPENVRLNAQVVQISSGRFPLKGPLVGGYSGQKANLYRLSVGGTGSCCEAIRAMETVRRVVPLDVTAAA